MKYLITFLFFLPLAGACQFCGYSAHANYNLTGANNVTISGDSVSSIVLTNCTNIHITKCRVQGSTGQAIRISGGSGITIDSTYIENVQQGIYAQNASNIVIKHNYIHNVLGAPSPATYHPIQYNNVTHGHIDSNKIEEDPIITQYTHDQISLYKSNGSVGDSITVIGNWIRLGQSVMNGSGPGGFTGGNNGACGINLTDSGGAWQVARGNYVITPGYIGMQVDGAGSAAKMDHNFVYSARTDISLVGISYYTTTHVYPGPSSIEISYNHITWNKNSGGIYNKFHDVSLAAPIGWSTNTADNSSDGLANSTMIPTAMVTSCTDPTPPIPPAPPDTTVGIRLHRGRVKLE
jgi:hypothetical protein